MLIVISSQNSVKKFYLSVFLCAGTTCVTIQVITLGKALDKSLALDSSLKALGDASAPCQDTGKTFNL